MRGKVEGLDLTENDRRVLADVLDVCERVDGYIPKQLEPKFFLAPKSEFKLTGGARHVDCDCSDCRPWTT